MVDTSFRPWKPGSHSNTVGTILCKEGIHLMIAVKRISDLRERNQSNLMWLSKFH